MLCVSGVLCLSFRFGAIPARGLVVSRVFSVPGVLGFCWPDGLAIGGDLGSLVRRLPT
jgi:hypothetical protein